MIDFIHQHWATITIAAAWLGREIKNLNRWMFEAAEYFQAHGGFKNWILKIWDNKEAQ